MFLSLNIIVCAFDFSGGGNSEGQYVTLGWFEQDDVKVVVSFLRNLGYINKICFFLKNTSILLYSFMGKKYGGGC